MTIDLTGIVLEANARALEILRLPYGQLVGQPLLAHVRAADDRLALSAHLAAVLRGQGTFTCVVHFVLPRSDLIRTIFMESIARGDGGAHRRMCQTAISLAAADRSATNERLERAALDEEKERRHQVARVQQRFHQMISAGNQLSESLDFEAAVHRAVWIAIPELASYCAVDLPTPDGIVARAAFARDDGDEEDLPFDPYAAHGSALVVRTGQAEIFLDPGAGDLAGLLGGPATGLSVLRKHVAAYVCMPLRAHGRTLGAMTFVRGRRPAYTPEDLALLSELSRRAALAIDNARLYREAQDSDQRKDEFLAMLGHELRNPLAAVVFAAATLRRKGSGDPGVLRAAEVVERQGKRLSRLVDDLLDVSRITRGKIALQTEQVVLQDVVGRAVESVRPLVDQRQHHLALRMPGEPVLLQADATRLEQVVVNLLANAAKYTDPGGRIDLDVSADGAEATVRVRDTGIGIPRDLLTTIFAPFAQINPTPDRTDRGLGIGLTLAKNLVELHGGRITAASAGPGKGSEFCVTLPLAHAPVRTFAPEPPPPGSSSNGAAAVAGPNPERRRVLVAEDNPDLGSLMEEKLRALGHDVRRALDGAEAIQEALDFHPQLLLIDLGLPGMTGFEVARRLRQEPAMAGAVIVAVTGYGGDETRHECLKAGFDHHFTKPLREDALMGLLRAS